MKLNSLFILFVLVLLSPLLCISQEKERILNARSNVIDTLFGKPIADPYRWLESLDSDSTKEWLKEQRKITRKELVNFETKYLGAIDKLEYGATRSTNLVKKGIYYFSFKYSNDIGSGNAPALFYRDSLNGVDFQAFNPAGYSTKGAYTIEDYTVSDYGDYVVVSLSKDGSDWRELRVVKLLNTVLLADKIEWVKFSPIVWWNDGFFYSSFKKPSDRTIQTESNTNQLLCYHKIGETQSQDKVVYTLADKFNTHLSFDLTSNKRYLMLYSAAKINGELQTIVAYKDLLQGVLSAPNLLISTPAKNNCYYNIVDYIEGKFVVETNLDAPRGKILLFDKDSTNHAEKFIPQFAQALKSVYHIDHKLFTLYFGMEGLSLAIFNYQGELLTTLPFDTAVNVQGFSALHDDFEVLYSQNKFYYPPVTYKLDLKTKKVGILNDIEVFYDPTKYASHIEVFKSKDGTEIPMYLTYKKGLNLANNNPVMLYGYGGFGESVQPFYDYSNIVFFNNNGILAVPLIRGGGEFGSDWHNQGKGFNKQNSFDDFIAAAEYLIAKGYTTKQHLAIKGQSNGGLLIGAMLTQRPDLFQVAIGEMGVYDMLRYHKFTGGRFLIREYGSAEDSLEFLNLLKYSPLHNLKDKTDYPATILITAENDDRIPPFHTFKFLSALQKKSGDVNRHLLYYEKNAGHKGVNGGYEMIKENAFILTFMFQQMGLELVTWDKKD